MSDQRLPRCQRLTKLREFQRVYELRCSVSDHWLIVYAREGTIEKPRLGLSVSRKVGGAVQRNRWKRLLRETFRLSKEQLPSGVDFVLIPRRQAAPTLDELKSSLLRLSHRAVKKLGKIPK